MLQISLQEIFAFPFSVVKHCLIDLYFPVTPYFQHVKSKNPFYPLIPFWSKLPERLSILNLKFPDKLIF